MRGVIVKSHYFIRNEITRNDQNGFIKQCHLMINTNKRKFIIQVYFQWRWVIEF